MGSPQGKEFALNLHGKLRMTRRLAPLAATLVVAGLVALGPALAQEPPAGGRPAPGRPTPASPEAKPDAGGDREIPAGGGTGRLSKGKKDGELKAGGEGSGVLKRKGSSKLDPEFDPAAGGKKGKPDDGPADPGGLPPRAPGKDDAAGGGGGGSLDDDLKKLDDVVTIKNNFSDIKCKRLPLNAKVSVDFQDAPLEAVTKLMSCWLDRNFVVATQKRGAKVTILSPQRVSVYEAYRAFLSSLAVNALTITKKGAFHYIVDSPDARSSGAQVLGPKGAVPDEDNIVTRLIRLKHIDVKDAEALAGKFKSKSGDVFVYGPTNTLIVTDSGSNIRQLMRLLAEVDVPLGTDKIFIRPVQHMDAGELVEKITAIFGEGGGGGGGGGGGRGPAPAGGGGGQVGASAGSSSAAKVTLTKVVADDRSNQIIVICTRSNYLKVDALIRKLDVPIPGEGAIHIHHLENADAEDVSQTLSSLTGGGSGGGGGSKSSGSKSSGSKSSGSKGGGGGGGGSASLFEGSVKITAHKATNSLVIESSLKDYVALQKVIAELDRKRKQVYVEAVVMEISTSKNRKTQLAGSAGTTFDIGGDTVPLLFGLGGLGMSGVSLQQLNSGGFAAGMQGPLLNVNAGNTGSSSVAAGVTLSIPAFGFLVQAIQENSDVNVLSTPHILTLNNEDAEITVGRKIPYRSQSMGGLGGLGMLGGMGSMGIPGMAGGLGGLGALGGLGSMMGGMMGGMVQFLDVDMTLKITPQINESDYIKLKIDESLNEVEGIDPNLGPTTSKRKVNNTVVVRDQQPVVIGGLVTDRESTGVAKIPVLGDLPLIGMLFRKNSTMIEKKNLLLIIVPHIIKDASDLQRMHENKMEQIRQFVDELATKQKEYQGKVDYRKKTGFLETVFKAVDKSAEERKMLEKAYFDNQDVDKVGSPDGHDLEYDPNKAKKSDKSKAGDDDDEDGPPVEVLELPDADKADKADKAGDKAGEKPADKAGDKAGEPKADAKDAGKDAGKDAPAGEAKAASDKPAKADKAGKPVKGKKGKKHKGIK